MPDLELTSTRAFRQGHDQTPLLRADVTPISRSTHRSVSPPSIHFAHEAVQNGHMRLYKIATEFQLADILTKALQVHQFESCLHGLLEDAED